VSGIIANPAAAGFPESQNGLRIGGIRYLFIRKIIMHSTVCIHIEGRGPYGAPRGIQAPSAYINFPL
jgi:hypothetical protein